MAEEKKQEQGITARMADDFSEWYTQVIRKAEMIEYGPVSGCMVIRPYAYAIWESLQAFLDSEIKKIGVQNAYFPMFIPESLLKKEQEHVEGFTPEVAWVTEHGNTKFEERLAIRPTSETIMYDSYSKWIRSHRDLPLRLNQWCNIVRWEFKHPMPFFRTREFLWQEGHTVFATREEAEAEVRQVLDIYARAYEELLAVPVMKGTKSVSEKFAGAVYTTSVEAFMPFGKAIQGATSHFLGQNFSKAFDISFLDKNEKKDYGWQNSWGFTTRSIGVMVAMHSDDKGLVLPPRVAPVQVVIVPILFSKKPESNAVVLKAAEKARSDLEKQGVRVILDADDLSSPGYKFNHWELKGVPLRLEIGPKDVEKKSAVAARRDDGSKMPVELADLKKKVPAILEEIQQALFLKAKAFLEKSIKPVKTFDELKEAVSSGGIAFADWCGEAACEAKVKEETGAKTLNIPFGKKNAGNCFCGNAAMSKVYFAKSY